MPKIRIKICGITRLEDALVATDLGVDALGFVFYPPSPRYINIEIAKNIIYQLPAFVTTVGLFVNATADEVSEVITQLPLDVLQFHGDEDVHFCRQFHRPYIKAIRVRNTEDIIQAEKEYSDARALLFDAYCVDVYGGTGRSFNWQLLPESIKKPWILAGGLQADNITEAIQITHALAVDVSGGVEIAKGIKDKIKIAAFLQGVQSAEK